MLLEPFIGARKLHIAHMLMWALSCALQSAEIGSDMEPLPGLEELFAEVEEEHADKVYVLFIEACQVMGHPMLLFRSAGVARTTTLAGIVQVSAPVLQTGKL
jgi:hypothetical protein